LTIDDREEYLRRELRRREGLLYGSTVEGHIACIYVD
jgi:hypothetical protein